MSDNEYKIRVTERAVDNLTNDELLSEFAVEIVIGTPTIEQLAAQRTMRQEVLARMDHGDTRHQPEPKCGVCIGTGDPGTGKPCICGGSGLEMDEVIGLRGALHELDKENEQLCTALRVVIAQDKDGRQIARPYPWSPTLELNLLRKTARDALNHGNTVRQPNVEAEQIRFVMMREIREYIDCCFADIEGCTGEELVEIEHHIQAAKLIRKRIVDALANDPLAAAEQKAESLEQRLDELQKRRSDLDAENLKELARIEAEEKAD